MSSSYRLQADFTPEIHTLEEAAAYKTGMLVGALCGAVIADPVRCIPMLDALDLYALNRPYSGRFLRDCISSRAKLEAETDEGRAEILAGIVARGGSMLDALRWMSRLCYEQQQAVDVARDAIKELRRLVIARGVLSELQRYAGEIWAQ
jgi:hypothetical protein